MASDNYQQSAKRQLLNRLVPGHRTAKDDANEVERTNPPRWKTSTRTQLNGLDTEITTDTKDRQHTRKYIPSITT